MHIDRKRMFHTFRVAKELGSYDEFPVLREDIDPQVHVSRNDRPQPFFLICERDSLVTQLSGTATLDLRLCAVRFHRLEPGDIVYVPAGTPTRYVPDDESVVLRYKALHPGLEGAAWFCSSCDEEIHRYEFDTADQLPQDGYWQACREFNDKVELRKCPRCGEVHPQVDLDGIRWPEVAEAIRACAES